MDDFDPIQKEKTFLEKIWESVSKKKRRKVIITTRNPYTKKEQNYVLCSYKIEDQEKMEEALWSFREAVLKTGMTVNELRENFIKKL